MSVAKPDVEAFSGDRMEKRSPDGPASHLGATRGEHRELPQRVVARQSADHAIGQILDGPLPTELPTIEAPAISEGPGSEIGPYRLLERLGEGAFGVVYMAEQREPVRRKVALKILKPGMDTAQVIARFEAEQQALALMDHPHIASVFDAGAALVGGNRAVEQGDADSDPLPGTPRRLRPRVADGRRSRRDVQGLGSAFGAGHGGVPLWPLAGSDRRAGELERERRFGGRAGLSRDGGMPSGTNRDRAADARRVAPQIRPDADPLRLLPLSGPAGRTAGRNTCRRSNSAKFRDRPAHWRCVVWK